MKITSLFILTLTLASGAGFAVDRNVGMDFVQNEAATTTDNVSGLADEYATKRNQEIRDRMEKLSQTSLSRTRARDPFGAPIGGMLRQPETPKVEASSFKKNDDKKAVDAEASGFSAAVQRMDVRCVNVGRKEFLCGADNIFEGDIVDISGSQSIYRVWVVSVSETGIILMDSKSRQTEVIKNGTDVTSPKTTNWGAKGEAKDIPAF